MSDPLEPSDLRTESAENGQPERDEPKPVPFRARLTIYLIAAACLGSMVCMCAFIFAIAATM